MRTVLTRVPATTANLGPGYDCLGVALQLENRIRVVRRPDPEWPLREETSVREPAQRGGAMAAEAASRFFARSGQEPFTFDWEVEGEVPVSRGLGSSVTVRLGLLSGLNGLTGSPLSRETLFELCSELEGHPDNAAPASFGGFTVATGGRVARFEVAPELCFVLLIPDFEISTPEARSVLPSTLDRLAAVQSCANACRVTAAFASREYELLRGAFEDALHQPFRKALIPFLPEVLRAGERAGALGGFLSGSGSTVCCVTLENPDGVAAAMASAAPGEGHRTVVTRANNAGMELQPVQ